MINTKYSDLQLSTEHGESVQCHKVILASVSNKVKKALERKDSDKVVIRSVKFGGLKTLVEFIYEGRVDIENSDELMDFADAYSLLQINLGPKINKTVQNITLNTTENETNESSNSYKCENCDKTFKSKKQLTRHLREVHQKQTAKKKKQSFACETCGTIFTVRIYLNKFN